MIVTVTMNTALDRILTVPNFQRGQRHRASEKLTLAGGKGIIVARALKRLGVPVVATGLVGGRNGRRILEELSEEAVLNDLVRIEDESRTSTAVIDPTSGEYTEIIEWGPLVHPEELEILREKIDYLSRGAEMVVFAGSLPRGVDESFYAEMIRELGRRGVSTVLDTEGEPLRLGVEAEPELVDAEPARGGVARRAGVLGRGRLRRSRSTRSPRWARATCWSSTTAASSRTCAARRSGAGRCASASRRPRSRSSHRSVPGRCCSPASSPRASSSVPPDEALRRAVAAGTASTLVVGSGQFELREAGRLVHDVSVSDLASVAAEH